MRSDAPEGDCPSTEPLSRRRRAPVPEVPRPGAGRGGAPRIKKTPPDDDETYQLPDSGKPEPLLEERHIELPKTELPKTELPETELPKTELPKTEQTKTERPKAERRESTDGLPSGPGRGKKAFRGKKRGS